MEDLFAQRVSLGFTWHGDPERAGMLHPLADRQDALYAFVREIPSYVASTLWTFENIKTSDLDAKIIIEYGRGIADMPTTAIRTVENYGQASRYLFERLKGRGTSAFSLDLDLISRLHGILARDEVRHPGELRRIPVRIEESSYIPPPHTQVPGILEQGLDFLNNGALPIPERAFATFLFLSRVQPFENANKRTAALCMNAVLLSHGYPAVVIEGPTREFLHSMASFYETAVADSMMDELFDMAVRQHGFYGENLERSPGKP